MKKTHKTKRKISKRLYKDSYPAHVFALVLVAVMFLEGMMFGVSNAHELQSGLKVLDMSNAVVVTGQGLASLAAPSILVAKSVDQFYTEASLETMELLEDNIVNHTVDIIRDINRFYAVAGSELVSILDVSDVFPSGAQTAYAY